jgi:hypothetical protein
MSVQGKLFEFISTLCLSFSFLFFFLRTTFHFLFFFVMGYAESREAVIGIKKLELVSDDDDYSSPRGVLDIPITGNDSDHSGSSSYSSSSISPTQKSMAAQSLRESHGGSQWKSVIEALKKRSVRKFSTIPLLTASYDKNLRRKLARIRSAENGIDCGVINGIPIPKPSWRNFDYAELAAATGNFSSGKWYLLFFFFLSQIC